METLVSGDLVTVLISANVAILLCEDVPTGKPNNDNQRVKGSSGNEMQIRKFPFQFCFQRFIVGETFQTLAFNRVSRPLYTKAWPSSTCNYFQCFIVFYKSVVTFNQLHSIIIRLVLRISCSYFQENSF